MDRFATGTLPANQSSFIVKGSIPDPEFQFAYEFSKKIAESEIVLLGGLKTGRSMELNSSEEEYSSRTLVVTHHGISLIDIIKTTNHQSVNLFAEHMINLVGFKLTGHGTTSAGLLELEKHWSSRINMSGAHINDGSGLSRMNAISANNFVSLLKYMSESSNADEFIESLPIAGESGTLRSVCRNQTGHGRVIAKSGTMTRIKSYAGYINSLSGGRYAFALIVNNYSCSSSTMRKKMEVIFNKIAAQ